MLGHPQLSDDLCSREITAEALVAGRAKSTMNGATGLRRDAQRGAIGLGDKYRFDSFVLADVEQPLARSIFGDAASQHGCSADTGRLFQLFAQLARNVRHASKVGGTVLMDPAQNLASTKRLFTQILQPSDQGIAIKIQ